ncbi:glypican-4 isoform X2 [Culicoides brevitarsis]|uniref:glypican-4 isoform X2 n=1 Tax=Culicoides brevitarsis TaxID=469753 RepID=UPI00307B82F3
MIVFYNTKFLTWSLVFAVQIIYSSCVTENSTLHKCESVQNILKSRGIYFDTNEKTTNGKYCLFEQPIKCCSESLENKLVNVAKSQLERNSKELIQKLTVILKIRAQKFNEHFKELLNQSKREFHDMFKRTYGIIYEQNSHVFSDLFKELEGYYTRGKVDLMEAMDSFFNVLYQKMFTVINMQYQFDDKYLGCVGEHMKTLRPFGDVPDKLSVILKRSFVATRTYAQALNTAAEITKYLENVRLTPACIREVAMMHVCGLCSGNIRKPCSLYCHSVMKSCFQRLFNDLNFEWDNFVSAMEKLSERLLGPFNIVMVVEPINIKISEAIMNFQDSGQDITNKIFQECGKPKFQSSINRIRRASKPGYSHYDALENNGNKKKRKNKSRQPIEKNYQKENREPTIDKLIRDIRQKVKDSKSFWFNLPYQMCNSDNFIVNSNIENDCWTAKDESLEEELKTTKTTDVHQSTSLKYINLISTQLYKLRAVNTHLRNAFNGMDVEWSDQDDSIYDSGSGSDTESDEKEEYGSGNGITEIDKNRKVQTNIEDVTEDYTKETTLGQETIQANSIRPTYSSTDPTPSSVPSSNMSPLKAVVVYLMPIFIAWFGGLFSNLL